MNSLRCSWSLYCVLTAILCAVAARLSLAQAVSGETTSAAQTSTTKPTTRPSGYRTGVADHELDQYIGNFVKRSISVADRITRYTNLCTGQTYRLNAPMFSADQSDCVTFVEHTLALALASSREDYYRLIARFRYIDGKIPFAPSQFTINGGRIIPHNKADELLAIKNRNQFIISEWNRNNTWCLEDITKKLGKGDIKPWIPLHHIVRPRQFYASQGLTVDMPDQKVVDSFIPREDIKEILPELKTGDIVEVIRGDLTNRYCDHMGIIVIDSRWNDPEGDVYILHSAPPVVRRDAPTRFLQHFKDVQGLKFLRLKPDATDAAARESSVMSSRMNVPPVSK